MCRFLAYKGCRIFLSDLLTRPERSLIRQSVHAEEREEPLNGDGFGVGWYAQELDPNPCVFTSIQPAWANRNLRRLADKIQSTCIFAHVRAASPGTPVTELNCHPFQYGNFLWMHNGRIAEFRKIRRTLREHLVDEFYDLIQGTTDSEHAFALFLNELRDHLADYELDDLRQALTRTIRRIEEWLDAAGITETSWLNFCVTDGHNVLATKYVTDPSGSPQSLYFSRGERYELLDGHYHMVRDGRQTDAVIIASEPLTAERSDWEPVPVNHWISVSPELHIEIGPVQSALTGARRRS
jgi:ergothioneine biosynthesis protein EgtC